MLITHQETSDIIGIRVACQENGVEVGRVRLYIFKNDAHEKPYGFLECVSVDDAYQGKGYGTALVQEVVHIARARGCYKLVLTSRERNTHIHEWYRKQGFTEWGKEFRMDLE